MRVGPLGWARQALRWYRTHRIWNINANIVAADIVSTASTALIIETIEGKLPGRIAIIVVTATVDGAISLSVFAALHWYTNRKRGMRDLARVQVHRWMLSPLHFAVASGLQYLLLAAGVRASLGVLIAYWTAVAVARGIHTLYGKRSGLFH